MVTRKRFWRAGILLALVAFLAQFGLLAGSLGASRQAATAGSPSAPSGSGNSGQSAPAADAPLVDLGNGFSVGYSYKNDVSPALSDMKPVALPQNFRAPENEAPISIPGQTNGKDSMVQRTFGAISASAPLPGTTFEGIGNSADGLGGCACIPPDTNGDVGPTQYLQTVNSSFAVYSKAGATLLAPRNINTLWSGFGGACEANNDGDPVALYDSISGRWLVSQFTASNPYNECIAISTTGDATGSYYRYAFQLSTTDFPDYPHLGVWPDGYYMSVNWFKRGHTYNGPRPYAFDRAKMVAGQPASFVTTSAPLGSGVAPIMPSDLDGATQPPAGQPNVFVGFGSTMPVYKFHADFTTPSNSTWTQTATLTPAAFTKDGTKVPQPGTAQTLDNLADRLMHRMAYRNFGTYESLVVNHTVDVGGGRAGVRWYEIRNPAGAPSIYQQSSYAPGSEYRWMGSAAQDKQGNIAVGYSVSSGSVYPSIRFAGRLAGDPLNTLGAETSIYAGTGFQGGYSRWGDYSALTVDPADDCTFWFTTEYNNSGTWHWRTKISNFKFSGCQ